jgi:hypothetical protein
MTVGTLIEGIDDKIMSGQLEHLLETFCKSIIRGVGKPGAMTM